jgi:superfamily II DNA or RNA helicase
MRALSDATAGLLKPIKLKTDDRLELTINKELNKFRARVFAAVTPSGMNGWPSTAAKQDWQQRIPERKQLDGANLWELAATDYTAEVISACWPREQLLFHDAQSETVFKYLLLSTTQQDRVAEVYARFKELGEVPQHDFELHPDESLRLRPDQQTALWCAMQSEGYSLFMEQGVGKTPVVVARVCNEARQLAGARMYRGLVVCPKNVRQNWVREFQRFATRPGKVTVIKGSFIERVTQVIETLMPEPDCEYGVCITSYEGMCRTWEALSNIDWDLGVLDEAHYIKWPLTQRSEYSRKLRDKCARRMALTGTPICNSPLDIYSIFEFLGDGYSGFKEWKAFKEFYGVFQPTDDEGHSKLIAIQNKPFMQERLARTSFIITKKEALPWLPDKSYDVIEAEMSPRQREAYVALAEKMLFAIEDELDKSKNKSMTIQNILTKLLRLAQVCAGYVVWDEMIDPNS